VTAEKNEMAEDAQRIITTIKQMDVSLNGPKDRHEYEAEDEELKITVPLIPCLQALKEKHTQISKIHKERFEQVKSSYLCARTIICDVNHLQNLFKPSSLIPPT
jgi:protein regulator of cytokinesis 1